MKKAIIWIIILGGLAAGWVYISQNVRLAQGLMQGKMAVVGRGDLTIPITATGEIQPKASSEIKPEASGEVTRLLVEPGDMVKQGELIIELDPEEEERSVTRASANLARAKATLNQEKIRLEQSQTVALDKLDAQIASTQAQLELAEWNYDQYHRLEGMERASMREAREFKSQFDQLTAQMEGLKADRKQAELQIGLAKENVLVAQEAFKAAETDLGDAQKGLRDTKIISPIDGMVSSIRVEVGEVVQQGQASFTGGTVVGVVADVSEVYVQTEVSDADIGAVLWLAPAEARPGGQAYVDELGDGEVPLNIDTSGLAPKLNMEGTPVTISVDAFRDDEFTGVIKRIYPEPKKVSNIVTYLVDIHVTSPNWRKLVLVQGMQADVKFVAQAVEDAILVPRDAIRRGPNGELGVFVPEKVEGEEQLQPKFIECRFGLDNGLYAELIEGEGIKEGTKVYTEIPRQFDNDDEEEDD